MWHAAARRLSGGAASISPRASLGALCAAPPLARRARAFGSEPHNDDWEANFEDLMAMEDSYGSGVEDLSSAAAELAGARMAEQKRFQEEMRRVRGIQPGDRVKIRVRHGAPYPEVVTSFHYASPFGGAGYGRAPAFAAAETTDANRSGRDPDESKESNADVRVSTARRGEKKKRWKTAIEVGYVVTVRGAQRNRIGVKRNGHPEDTDVWFPTYPKEWVEVLDVGEMWEMKTGPRNLGAFASEEDYAREHQNQRAEATRATRRDESENDVHK
jgi:hypothetical protein